MAYTENFFASKASRWAERGQSDDFRREELIRVIEHSVENLTLQEFLPCKRAELEREALYYDMSTKNYINE